MKINEYTVHFETLTPLRAGDAWFQNKAPLKASSIMEVCVSGLKLSVILVE